MAQLLLITKILPTGIDVDLDGLVESIRTNLKDGIKLRNFQKEPLAFCLHYLKSEFILDDKEGQMDSLENTLHSVDGVSAVSYTHLTLPTILLV